MNIKELDIVPKKPGVYLWKNEFDTIIYVGKAKNLNNRMKQYFRGMLNSYKTSKLVENIASFEYVITSSEKEALILERNLIEKNSPEYNISLTDDKRYPYIKVALRDKLDISLIYRIKSVRDKRVILYGPFPSGFGARRMVNLLNRLTIYDKGLPNKTNDKAFWEKQFLYAKKLLSSGSKSLLSELQEKMYKAAELEQFEVAQDIKESIKALEFYQDKQNVELQGNKNIDVMAFVEKDGFLSVSMLFYRQGTLLSKNDKIIEITTSKSETIRQFVSQYYSFNIEPDEIFSNEEIETTIKTSIPQKGTNRKIIKIALTNAKDNIELKLQSYIRKEELTLGSIRKLETLLGIKSASHIVMMDNSNTANTQPVSAAVSYRNGIKQKSEYRKYNLEVRDRRADVDYMRQGVLRHFSGSKNPVPDLFIVDGGKAQVNEIKDLIPDIKVIGLVKNEKHITKALINLEGNQVEIEDTTLLNFLRGIQEEVDRFAKYHHTVRRRTTLEGILTSIPGIGPSIEKRLLTHFGSYSGVYNASLEDLAKITSDKMAIKIKEKLK